MRPLSTLVLVMGVVVLSTAVGAAGTWNVYAHAPLPNASQTSLREAFLSQDISHENVEADPDSVVWQWWAWSDETGSEWPNDDALYRMQGFDLNASNVSEQGAVVEHALMVSELITVDGIVKVVAAEDSVRFVTFELSISPLVNLSNQTLMYLVLTEDIARDNHRREATHLVRELRPEVGFSLQANNTTETTLMLSSEHLMAAGVDLIEQPTGWRYTVAVFGGSEDSADSGLMVLKHDRLPSPSLHLTPTQTWLPVILTACTLVLLWSLVHASSLREKAIPVLLAQWSEHEEGIVKLTVQAGSQPFRITRWEAKPPWAFRRRPPVQRFAAGERHHFEIGFKEIYDAECHLETSIEVEELGAWRQHVWLASPVNRGRSPSTTKEEE